LQLETALSEIVNKAESTTILPPNQGKKMTITKLVALSVRKATQRVGYLKHLSIWQILCNLLLTHWSIFAHAISDVDWGRLIYSHHLIKIMYFCALYTSVIEIYNKEYALVSTSKTYSLVKIAETRTSIATPYVAEQQWSLQDPIF
jgi:hypothetical protein